MNPGTAGSTFAPHDTQRMVMDEYWRLARQGMLLAVGVHTAFGIFALAIGAPLLMYLQITSIAVYAISYFFSFRGLRRMNVTLAWLDLLGHSTLASWIVGPESGFHYYSWILLPLLFTNPQRDIKVKLRIALGLCMGYLGIDWWLSNTTPLAQVSPGALAALRYFNIGCYLIATAITAIFHAKTVMEAEAKLRAAADTDALTGLLNRRRMSDRMQQELVRARSEQRSVAVLLLDIDHFKQINDQFGHAAGDDVIARVGDVLRTAVRERDLVARWGGEEFLMLLPGASLAEAYDVAERIRGNIADTVFAFERPLRVSATVGLAIWREGESLDETIGRADRKLYEGKARGRNCVVVDRELSADQNTAQQIAS